MTDEGRIAVGVDIGGTAVKAAGVTRDGTVLERIERPTDASAATKSLLGVLEDLVERLERSDHAVAAIGVGAAGFVDFDAGAVTFSPNVVYDDPQIATAVSDRFDLPVFVDNDANAAVWGERTYGCCAGASDVVMLTLGTGIGSGIVANGELVRGATGAGAEIGHMVVDPSGPTCPCGLRGCLEQLASGTAIERLAHLALGGDPASAITAFAEPGGEITGESVAKAAREYDQTARDVLRKAGTALGIGLANVVNVFDPELIVLGGSVVNAGEPYLGPARDQLARMMQAQRRRPMRLDVTSLRGDGGIVGAAALAWGEVGEAA
ncbi:MAG TPA: ROK family protein [Actinomycetota bacterium]|nr:ROK family protein [Actinomycetota bacterium]